MLEPGEMVDWEHIAFTTVRTGKTEEKGKYRAAAMALVEIIHCSFWEPGFSFQSPCQAAHNHL